VIPSIQFHEVAAIEADPAVFHEANAERAAFAFRDLRFVDAAGRAFEIRLFADTPGALALPGEICGHSACSQNYIETGSRECVDGSVVPLSHEQQGEEAMRRG
jgi:hypothetical protein